MAKTERMREAVQGSLTVEHFEDRKRSGWRLAAVEWERTAEGDRTGAGFIEEVPYGLRVSDDCVHLEENPEENQIVVSIMEGIVQDRKLSEIAADLNLRGYHTRSGADWGPGAIFNLLPRLIETGPRIFNTADWVERRRRLLRAV
jgi:hypothetical protein